MPMCVIIGDVHSLMSFTPSESISMENSFICWLIVFNTRFNIWRNMSFYCMNKFFVVVYCIESILNHKYSYNSTDTFIWLSKTLGASVWNKHYTKMRLLTSNYDRMEGIINLWYQSTISKWGQPLIFPNLLWKIKLDWKAKTTLNKYSFQSMMKSNKKIKCKFWLNVIMYVQWFVTTSFAKLSDQLIITAVNWWMISWRKIK